MPKPVYFDTSIFIEIATPRSKYKKLVRELLQDLQERRVHVYTSILTVQEMSVAVHRKGTVAKDILGDIKSIARVYTMTKEIAMTAGKLEAAIKDIADDKEKKRAVHSWQNIWPRSTLS